MNANRPTLSLAELEQHDSRPTGQGPERRFLCPLPSCEDHQGRDHKNLAVNIDTGLWRCCRCEASGKLTEKWESRTGRAHPLRLSPHEKARRALGLSAGSMHTSAPAPIEPLQTPTWRKRWDAAPSVVGTPGADYLASRGIPEAIATAADVRYFERWEHWAKDEGDNWRLEGTSRRVVFPIVNQVGEIVGIHARSITAEEFGDKFVTRGTVGVFATSGAETLQSDQLAIVEAPIDALSLAVAGVAAVATCGTACADWLPRALAFKTVMLAHDADAPGDEAAARLVSDLGRWGASAERWRPATKDWNQVLQESGLNALRVCIDEPTPMEAHVPNPGAQPADEPDYDQDDDDDDVEVPDDDELLLVWLKTAPRPAAPFQLWPWARVIEPTRFYTALRADIASGVRGPRYHQAVADLQRLWSLFSQASQPAAA
jgi:hypothetical protein